VVEPLRSRARKRAGALVVDSFFKGASRLGRALPAARPEAPGVEVARDLPYVADGDRHHLLDVYRPVRPPLAMRDAQGRLPAILYVHGGGFRMLDKDSHWLPALIYARRGYVVFNVSYRLAPKHAFPAAIEDVAAALRWVAENGGRYGADLDRVGFAGESAGGHLVLAHTLCTSFRRPEPWARATFDAGIVPKATLPAMGLLQVSDPHRFRALPRWLFDRIEEVTEAYLPGSAGHDLADPLVVLERGDVPDRPFPAIHACCGTADPLIDDTRRLEAVLARRELAHEVSYWPGGVHAFHMFVFQRQARACWREMLAFTHRHVAGVDDPIREMPWARPVP
jgi:acetyl esterase